MKRILEWKVVRWGQAVVRGFLGNHCSLHAAGLTYFSMLALMPVLCCILVLAKAAHVDQFARDQINAQIDGLITSVEQGQAGVSVEEAQKNLENETDLEKRKALKKRIAVDEFAKQARGFSDQLFARIDKFDVRKLGLIGLAMLLWTIISSLGQVEASVDEIWGLSKARPLWKKAYLYLFVVTVMPVLAALAMSLPVLRVVKEAVVSTMGSTELTKWASDGLIWFVDSYAFRLCVSLGVASVAFGYFLWVMPNCRVRKLHAWYGGLFTAVLFAAVMKLCAIAQIGIAKSSALYGSFAFLPIILAWMYMSWQVVLLGACIVRAFEEVEDRTPQVGG